MGAVANERPKVAAVGQLTTPTTIHFMLTTKQVVLAFDKSTKQIINKYLQGLITFEESLLLQTDAINLAKSQLFNLALLEHNYKV